MLKGIGKAHTSSKTVEFAKKQGSNLGSTIDTLYELQANRKVFTL